MLLLLLLLNVMSSETLVLSSELSKDAYPENNGGSFTNELTPPLVFESNGSIKINDLAYVPGSWDNVRINSNKITVKMRGYPVWGLVPGTLYHFGEITFERGTRQKYLRNSNRSFRDVDVYRLQIVILKMIDTDRWTKLRHTSDWMPGKPFDIKNQNPTPPPIFRTLKENDLSWDLANKTPLSILIPGKVAKSNEWQISKCYLPCKYYHLFADFQLAFVKCVDDTIAKMFAEADAHPTAYETLKIKLADFNGFSNAETPPKEVWVFINEFQFTGRTTVCEIKVGKAFRNATDLQIILAPIMANQLGLVADPRDHVDAIPFTVQNLREKERVWDDDPKSLKKGARWGTEKIAGGLSYFSDDRWNFDKDGDSVRATYNFYGAREIDLSRNDVTSLWIFCDAVDTSYVGNVQIPLLQLVPAVGKNTIESFERFGMLHGKRINKGRVNNIKIWITETFDGKPIHFREPVVISLEVQRDA